MDKKIVIANWKANPATLAEAQVLFGAEILAAEQYPSIQTIVCPPFLFLEELSKIDSRYLGAQDIEIFGEVLKNFGVSHVLIGHSDRRYGLGETDELINKKLKVSLESGLVPVLLVGEKEKGVSQESVLIEQLGKDLTGLSAEQIAKILFTYEPVWAISTNSANSGFETDTPENVVVAVQFIRDFLNKKYGLSTVKCLYGGSINAQNVVDFLQSSEIDGVIIGGASLDINQFSKILKVASNINSQ